MREKVEEGGIIVRPSPPPPLGEMSTLLIYAFSTPSLSPLVRSFCSSSAIVRGEATAEATAPAGNLGKKGRTGDGGPNLGATSKCRTYYVRFTRKMSRKIFLEHVFLLFCRTKILAGWRNIRKNALSKTVNAMVPLVISFSSS